MHVARRFELFLDTYRRPDGGRWGGADLERATGGIVTRSYVANLRRGRIENPGYEKMRTIAKAMGFSPQLWFEDDVDGSVRLGSAWGQALTARVEHLFETIKNPKTGEPYTNAEVARLGFGDLNEAAVEGIRTGKIPDPTVGQVAALAAAFGVPPSYLLDRGERPSVLDEELLEGLRDETTREIIHEALRLPERERRIILGIVRQFDTQRAALAREDPTRR